MANSSSNLDLLAQSQQGKEVTANALFDAASPGMLFGRRAAGCIALTWAYYGGPMIITGTPTRISNGSLSLAASSVIYVEATTAGVVSTNTTGWTAGRSPLYKITTGAASVTSYEDWRCMALATV
mgnify:FL=1